MLSHDEIEEHNSRRRYAIFTYGTVQLSLFVNRARCYESSPTPLKLLIRLNPLPVPRPHGTRRTEPQDRYGSIADQEKKNHMDEHLKIRIMRHNVLPCFLSQPVLFMKWNAFFVTSLFVVNFFVTHPALARM